MRNTIIPAQITTVEDRIAGSFSLTQILILMIPVFWTTLVYALFPPTMKIVIYKIIAILIVFTISIILIIRIKEKIVALWLVVIFKYYFRPKYFLFNKNSLENRSIEMPIITKKKKQINKTKIEIVEHISEINIADKIMFEQLVSSGRVAVSYKFENKK